MAHHGIRRRAFGITAALVTVLGLVAGAPSFAAERMKPSPPLTWKNANKEFVQRDGAQLTIDGEPFRFNGANAYWLGLDENVGGIAFPTHFRIKNALDTAKEQGLSVIRTHMMTSTAQDDENPLAIMPRLGEYNDEAFGTIDYAIAYAGKIGIRLVLPLTDEWAYYHGGHRDFTEPLGLSSADFYTDERAIDGYQDYVEHILDRRNALTGVKYVDDPTVLAWELGNELEGMTLDWINEQSAFIKGLAPHQLVAAGRRFDIDPDTLKAKDVDIVDVHYYPPTAARVASDAATVVAAGKVYIAGEYGSPAASAELLQPLVDNDDVTGMMYWSLFPHNDRGGFVPHDDGFTQHYPGETAKSQAQNEAIKAYSRALGYRTDTIALAPPLITEITSLNGINSVAWRGSAGASTYRVERSDRHGRWVTVAEAPAEASPVIDERAALGGATYRVTALKADGRRATSEAVRVAGGAEVLVDPLESFLLTAAHDGVRIAPTTDGVVAVPTRPGASLTWKRAGLESARFAVDPSAVRSVQVLASRDGKRWTSLKKKTRPERGRMWVEVKVHDADFVKLVMVDKKHVSVSRAVLTARADRAALIDPLADFSLLDSRTGSLSIDSGAPSQFGGDTSRAKRDSSDPASMTWRYDDISAARFDAWYWPDQPVVALRVDGSTDGKQFTPLTPEISGGAGNWKRYEYSLTGLQGVNYLRVSWDAATGEPWTPQIGQLALFSPHAAAPGKPAAFELTAPANGTTGLTGTPVLTWGASADAAYYRVVIASDPAMKNVISRSPAISATSYAIPTALQAGTTYYWSVTAVNGYGETSATPQVASFGLAALPTALLEVETFEQYATDDAVTGAYVRNSGGGPVAITLDRNPVTGSAAAALAYDLTGPGYAGVVRTLPAPQSWWGYEALAFDAKATVGQTVTIQFVAGGSYWEKALDITSSDWQTYEIPLSDFVNPPWAAGARLDLSSVTQFAVYLGGSGTGQLLIDDLRMLPARSAG